MIKIILYLWIFCVLFISGCGIVGLFKEDYSKKRIIGPFSNKIITFVQMLYFYIFIIGLFVIFII